MARTDMAPKNPGSFADFEAAHPDLDRNEQIAQYSDLIHEYRIGQAAYLGFGLDLDDLHTHGIEAAAVQNA
jgi:hypothetical protein